MVNHPLNSPPVANQRHHLHRRHFKRLLEPLVQAGWEYYETQIRDNPGSKNSQIFSCTLTRSCMVVQANWLPDQDRFQFEPVPDSERPQATPHIRFTNMVSKLEPITRVSHGPLTEFDVVQLAGRLGVLEPTRFVLPTGASVDRQTVFDELYDAYVFRDAAAWRTQDGRLPKRITHREVDGLLHDLLLPASVIPDPVPSAAALGIALQAWRHGPIENIHAGQRRPGDTRLTDALMMKLNIAATRIAQRHISLEGVDWLALGPALTNSRRLLRDGRTMDELFSGETWDEITEAISQELQHWQHIEAVVGPRATLRLLSMAGSTSYTKRWWGQSWWRELATEVAQQVHKAGIELPNHTGDPFDLLADLPNDPDELPDETLAVCIDLPTGKGLRWVEVTGPVGRELSS